MVPELNLVAAFSAGLLGSSHCLAMCGGIAALLGVRSAAVAVIGMSLSSLLVVLNALRLQLRGARSAGQLLPAATASPASAEVSLP